MQWRLDRLGLDKKTMDMFIDMEETIHDAQAGIIPEDEE